MQAACARFAVPMAAVALQCSLREPRITSTIVGMSRPERYDEALALAAHPIPDDLWSEIEALTPGPEHWLSMRLRKEISRAPDPS